MLHNMCMLMYHASNFMGCPHELGYFTLLHSFHELVAERHRSRPPFRFRRRADRRHRGAAAGRGLRHHRRHAARIRTLCRHDPGHDRRFLRLLAPAGLGADHGGLHRAVLLALGVRGARHPGLCQSGAHPDLHGGRARTDSGLCAHGRLGQFHLSFGGGGLHGRCRHPDRRQAAQEFLRRAHPERRAPSAHPLPFCGADPEHQLVRHGRLPGHAAFGHRGQEMVPAHPLHDRGHVDRLRVFGLAEQSVRTGRHRDRDRGCPAGQSAAAVAPRTDAGEHQASGAIGAGRDPVRADRGRLHRPGTGRAHR